MNENTNRTARFTAVLIAAFAALAIAAPFATAGTAAPPRVHVRQMHWYHWHRSPGAKLASSHRSTVVIGLKRMRDLEALRAVYGFYCVRELPHLRAAVLHISTSQLRALLADGPADRRIRYVSALGPTRHPMGLPNDPYVSKIDGRTGVAYEWQFIAAHVDRALELSKGDPHVVVGVIDTGVDVVPDLQGKVDSIWTVTPNGRVIQVALNQGNDDRGHGTAVTSLIVANVDDGLGIAGFGGNAHAVVVRAGDLGSFDDTSLAIALDKLVSMGVRVVNMSLGGRLPSSPILVDAIHRAAAAGVLIVAAAGNEGGSVSWPAAALQPADGGRSVGLAVGATNADGSRANFSNWGRQISLMAPGGYSGTAACGGVLVALPSVTSYDYGDDCFLNWWDDAGNRYAYMKGTSFASPEVAGIAGLILAVRPGLKPWQVADIIKQSASRTPDGWTPSMGCGQLDAGAALELALSRSDAEWAERAAQQTGAYEGDACSTGGTASPSWPTQPADQTITFDRIANQKSGAPDFEVHATASSGLPVNFQADGKCVLIGGKVHLTGVGACLITASQSGDDQYRPAEPVSQLFLILRAKPKHKHPKQKV